jgi:hypothetical protein
VIRHGARKSMLGSGNQSGSLLVFRESRLLPPLFQKLACHPWH